MRAHEVSAQVIVLQAGNIAFIDRETKIALPKQWS